jgi:hypothetical protein
MESPSVRLADKAQSGDLTHQQRLNYVNAVLCLQHLPPRTPANVSAGARSRVSIRDLTEIRAKDKQSDVFYLVRRFYCHTFSRH